MSRVALKALQAAAGVGGGPRRKDGLIFTKLGLVYKISESDGALSSSITGDYGFSGNRFLIQVGDAVNEQDYIWANPVDNRWICGRDTSNKLVVYKYADGDTAVSLADSDSTPTITKVHWHPSGEYIFARNTANQVVRWTFDMDTGTLGTATTQSSHSTRSGVTMQCIAGNTYFAGNEVEGERYLYAVYRFDPDTNTLTELNITLDKGTSKYVQGTIAIMPTPYGNMFVKTSGAAGNAYDGGQIYYRFDHTKTDSTIVSAAATSNGPINQITFGSWKFGIWPALDIDNFGGWHREYNGTWGFTAGWTFSPDGTTTIQFSSPNNVSYTLGTTLKSQVSPTGKWRMVCNTGASPYRYQGSPLSGSNTHYGHDNSTQTILSTLTGNNSLFVFV